MEGHLFGVQASACRLETKTQPEGCIPNSWMRGMIKKRRDFFQIVAAGAAPILVTTALDLLKQLRLNPGGN